MSTSKPVFLPMDPNSSMTQEGNLMYEPDKYRRLVGKLIYLTIARPDIIYTVQALSQYMHSPTTAHFHATIRVLRYLKQSPG